MAWMDGRWRRAVVSAETVAFRTRMLAENIAVKNGKPLFLREHSRRLRNGLKALGMARPAWDLADACRQAMERSGIVHGNLQVRAWSGKTPVSVTRLLVRPLARETPLVPPASIALMTSASRHYGAGSLQGRVKAADMLPNLLAKWEISAWAEDGLRLTPEGLVAEGVWTNVLARKGRTLLTPPAAVGILEGVTRSRFLARWRRKNGLVREIPMTRYDLYTADQAWVCSSLWGVVPVSSVDGRPLAAD